MQMSKEIGVDIECMFLAFAGEQQEYEIREEEASGIDSVKCSA